MYLLIHRDEQKHEYKLINLKIYYKTKEHKFPLKGQIFYIVERPAIR